MEKRMVVGKEDFGSVEMSQSFVAEEGHAEQIDYSEHDAEHDGQIFIKVIGSVILLVFLGFFFTFIVNPKVISSQVVNKRANKDQQRTEALHQQIYEETNKGYSIIQPSFPSAKD